MVRTVGAAFLREIERRGAPGGPPPGTDLGPTDLEGGGYHEDDVPFD